MRFEHLISRQNLELAWRRITTGTNYQYKRYFRDLYYAYEIAIDENLRDLRERLKGGGGSYLPKSPTRVYVPKASGLQRPLTLLSLEDQILLQAIANYFETKLAKRRKTLQLKSVFSNILHDKRANIFFFRDWHNTYGEFEKKIQNYFANKLRWIAHFDLAAFYDTISHDLLLRMVSPRLRSSETIERVREWFKIWSSDNLSSSYGHGIPQGPIASNFLSECFLLPIDEVLTKEFAYIRYGDDIRLFASSEKKVRQAAIKLEVLCRGRGLIPQGKKYTILEAKTLSDALGMLPSIAPPNNEDADKAIILPAKEAIKKIQKALTGKPQRISDKSRARFVLYHGEPSPRLLKYVLKLLPHHPEHIDAFIYYLSHYRKSKSIIKVCTDYLRDTPYEYIQGELWHVLARMMPRNKMKNFMDKAIRIIKNGKSSFSTRWGACHFLCSAEHSGLGNYANFVKYQKSHLLQSLLVSILPDRCYNKNKKIVEQLLRRSSFEPGIMLTEQFISRELRHLDFNLKARNLHSQVQNVFRAVGIIHSGFKTAIDPIGEILARRYKINQWKKWKLLLGSEYVHALQILCQADPVFDSGRSRWLSYQNSFNDVLFRSIQKYLNDNSLPGAARTIGRDGKLISFGTLVDANQPFSRIYATIAEAFRETNSRRNTLPGSHPYEIRGGTETLHLKKQEQTDLVKKLSVAYSEIIINFDSLFV